MRLRSDSFEFGRRLPAEFAAGQAHGESHGFAPNRNAHQLAWDGIPTGMHAFALLCIDPDAPPVAEMAGRAEVVLGEAATYATYSLNPGVQD